MKTISKALFAYAIIQCDPYNKMKNKVEHGNQTSQKQKTKCSVKSCLRNTFAKF